jgi:histidinol-phosphate aminotransferase
MKPETPTALNRRDWLKRSALLATGLATAPHLFASPRGAHSVENQLWPTHELAGNPPLPPGAILLGSNENPYGISPHARQAIVDALGNAHRYGFNSGDGDKLKTAIAEKDGVAKESILMTAGSSEVLGIAGTYIAYLGKSRGKVVFPWPTFSLMADHFGKLGVDVVKVPLTPDKLHDLPKMLASLDRKTKMVYVCNPNNPTGTLLAPSVVKEFCQEASKRAYVMVDEAYIDFLNPPDNESVASLVASNPKIIVSRTFSKIYAMAGLRTGYALAHPDTIKALEPLRHGGNLGISSTSTSAALASLRDREFAQMSKEKNAAARAYVQEELGKMNLRYIPSHGNFVYFSLANYASDFVKDMQARNIYVRQWDDYGAKWGRVSIGKLEEMQQFALALKQLMPS